MLVLEENIPSLAMGRCFKNGLKHMPCALITAMGMDLPCGRAILENIFLH